jgi:hypothetical protein
MAWKSQKQEWNELKEKIPSKKLLSDIRHLVTWYQGRDVDRCDNVEHWLDKQQ